MSKRKIHKMAVRSGWFVHLCDKVLRADISESSRMNWKRVTCARCLRQKPKPARKEPRR